MSEVQESNVYAAPETDVETFEIGNGERPEFHLTGTVKVVVFYILSFGMYTLVWFYQQWRKQKETGLDCWPVPRAIFSIIFCYSLFSKVKALAVDKNVRVGWSAALLTILFIVATILANFSEMLIDSYDVDPVVVGILLFSISLFVPATIFFFVQRTINRIYVNSGIEMNEKFTLPQWIFVVLAIVIWVLAIFGLAQGI